MHFAVVVKYVLKNTKFCKSLKYRGVIAKYQYILEIIKCVTLENQYICRGFWVKCTE